VKSWLDLADLGVRGQKASGETKEEGGLMKKQTMAERQGFLKAKDPCHIST